MSVDNKTNEMICGDCGKDEHAADHDSCFKRQNHQTRKASTFWITTQDGVKIWVRECTAMPIGLRRTTYKSQYCQLCKEVIGSGQPIALMGTNGVAFPSAQVHIRCMDEINDHGEIADTLMAAWRESEALKKQAADLWKDHEWADDDNTF